jgi:hypothetical protein
LNKHLEATLRTDGELSIQGRSYYGFALTARSQLGAFIWFFREQEVSRSQEIALFATSKTLPRKELVRQQWVFSPQGATTEVEDYFFDLSEVTALELEIDPGRHDKHVFASLQSIQIG